MSGLPELLDSIRNCTQCAGLPLGPKPIFQIDTRAPILIVGQAPGRLTHAKGVPFDDPSGNRLRNWLGVSREEFYDPAKFAIFPMGLCFPGTAKGGDLPPRPECAPLWRGKVLEKLPNVELTLLLGQFSHGWHLGKSREKSLTQTVVRWQDYWPTHLPLPHPSPRNMRWFKINPWFEAQVLPVLRARVGELTGKNRET
jgi:uracil-DNA glycosylase